MSKYNSGNLIEIKGTVISPPSCLSSRDKPRAVFFIKYNGRQIRVFGSGRSAVNINNLLTPGSEVIIKGDFHPNAFRLKSLTIIKLAPKPLPIDNEFDDYGWGHD